MFSRMMFAAGSIVPALGGGAHLVRSGAGTTVTMTIHSDGSITVSGAGTFVIDTISGDLWFDPVTTGIGSSYWVRATVTSGSLSSGSTGTWDSLSSSRSWSRTQNLIGESSVTFTIDIASDSGGANIVATGSFTLTAERDS